MLPFKFRNVYSKKQIVKSMQDIIFCQIGLKQIKEVELQEIAQKRKHSGFNHFIFLYITSRYNYHNIQMSFSNYATMFFPPTYCFDMSLFQIPYTHYTIENPSPIVKVEQNTQQSQETKSSLTLHQPNITIIEQKLRKLHFFTQHHHKCHWTAEQDKLLERLVQVQKLEWKQIPKHFKQRTQNMCYSRYRRISMSTRDRLWTPYQENIVIDYVNKYGEKWKFISQKMPKYSAKQIRERYLNYLRPSIVRQEFQFEEDLKIVKYVLQKGKHWRKMEDILPGRSQGCIKGRYYGKLQKIIEESRKPLSV